MTDWLDDLERLEKAATKGPWKACCEGNCQCKTITCEEHPIAKVTSGKWGDDYATLRLVGESSLQMRAEAYMAQHTYGEVDEAIATVNVSLISALRNAAPQLLAIAKAARELSQSIRKRDSQTLPFDIVQDEWVLRSYLEPRR